MLHLCLQGNFHYTVYIIHFPLNGVMSAIPEGDDLPGATECLYTQRLPSNSKIHTESKMLVNVVGGDRGPRGADFSGLWAS